MIQEDPEVLPEGFLMVTVYLPIQDSITHNQGHHVRTLKNVAVLGSILQLMKGSVKSLRLHFNLAALPSAEPFLSVPAGTLEALSLAALSLILTDNGTHSYS